MLNHHVVLSCLWIIYCLLHSLFANDRFKNRIYYSGIKVSTYRLSYNLFALAGLIAILFFQINFKSFPIIVVSLFTKILSIFFLFPGILIMGICIKKYFTQMSGLAKGKERIKPVLEAHGIHSYVRHPLYLGTFLFLVGIFFQFPLLSNLIAIVIIITYTLIGIAFEEKKLVNEFGEAYRDYQKKVAMIIPFIK